MTQPVLEPADEVLPPEPKGELVHWMTPRRWSLGATGVTLAAVSAFALGVAVAVTVLAMLRRLPRDDGGPRWARRNRF
jgi:hypothetical protein